MALIVDKQEVLEVYQEASELKWVIPCFCTENLTTTEAVLDAVKSYGEQIGNNYLPVTIAITNCYSHRSQSVNYSHTGNWEVGLRLFLEDLRILTSEISPYKDLRVLVHLDHIQHDIDKELLSWDMKMFSSIMFDASGLSLSENILATNRFVDQNSGKILIEGACDEIMDAGTGGNNLTTPENAEIFLQQTGCDLIVANLGTEHRANTAELRYHGELAKEIKRKIGTKIVLHGASSVGNDQIHNLFDDGICKVNIWTILERDTSPVLFTRMLENASKITGKKLAAELRNNGLIGKNVEVDHDKSIQYFTTKYRQDIIFREMKRIIKDYLSIWYV